jgi:hypothetical protein
VKPLELRLFRALGDCGCPLLSIGSRTGTDPVRTGFRSLRLQTLPEPRLIGSLVVTISGRSAGTLSTIGIREFDPRECGQEIFP